MDEMVDAMDRISELPCVISHQIMLNLSAKEVAQTSILSKRWNRLRKSFPVWDFDETYFVGKDLNSIDFDFAREDKGFQERLDKFVKFVDASLIQFCESNFHVLKFRLRMILLDVKKLSSPVERLCVKNKVEEKGSCSPVESWILLALENKVEELDLCFVTQRDYPHWRPLALVYTLPLAIYSANLVTALKLEGCKLEVPSDTVSLNSLKTLTLERSYITKGMIQKLIDECPMLKDLFFLNCMGFTSLIIEERSKYASLENLFVIRNHFLQKVDISSERLKKLQFANCSCLTIMVVRVPSLLSFSYVNKHMPYFFAKYRIHAPCPWRVSFIDNGAYPFSCLVATKELLQASKQIEDLSIHYNWKMRRGYFKHSVYYHEIRTKSPSRPCEVENLALYVDAHPSDYEALLNNFLFICYPKDLSVMTCSDAENGFGEWLFAQLRDRCITCCSTHDIKCWRHYLKDVSIESKDPELPNMTKLMDGWPMFSRGICQFRLDWCFHALVEKTRKLPANRRKSKLARTS